MDIQFTARRFRARSEVKQRAIDAVKRLGKYYDGIVSADVILSYERSFNSVKTAEINLRVHGITLSAKERAEEYEKSIDAAAEKLAGQLTKYKSKLHQKDKKKVRALKDKV